MASAVPGVAEANGRPGGGEYARGLAGGSDGYFVEVNRRLLAASRRAGLKVIYLQMTYKPDLSDAGDMSEEAEELYARLASEGHRSARAAFRELEDRPLAVLAIAFVAGLIGGRFLLR